MVVIFYASICSEILSQYIKVLINLDRDVFLVVDFFEYLLYIRTKRPQKYKNTAKIGFREAIFVDTFGKHTKCAPDFF